MSASESHLHCDRPGFTVVELLIVIIITGILATMASSGAGRYLDGRGAANARNAFAYMAVRARSAAIEQGRPARLQIDPSVDRAWIVMGRTGAGDTLESVTFTGEYRAAVVISGNQLLTICYSPRGIALASGASAGSCSGGLANAAIDVDFTRGNATERAVVRPLGQVLSQ